MLETKTKVIIEPKDLYSRYNELYRLVYKTDN